MINPIKYELEGVILGRICACCQIMKADIAEPDQPLQVTF